jgi:mono/diheme cytochrome c family protein
MVPKKAVLLGIVAVLLGLLLVCQGSANAQTKNAHLKLVTIPVSQPDSGRLMYEAYCAACHGMDGRGTGPAAQYLRIPPPDLTTMSRRYNEQSVMVRVRAVLRFNTESKAHGTVDMPTWGPLFHSLSGSNRTDSVANLRMYNLAQFVQSLQKK